MEQVWIVFLEVLAFIDSAPIEGQLGFIDVVTSASTAELAEKKVRTCLESYEWQILSVEDISEADPEHPYGGDVNELIEDVLQNPTHVRLSTLHSYKAN